jgi:hypothetical protein
VTKGHLTYGNDDLIQADRRPNSLGVHSTASVPGSNSIKTLSSSRMDKPIAKMFVICCRCNHWHDMPSDVYAKLAFPNGIPKQDGSVVPAQSASVNGNFEAATIRKDIDVLPSATPPKGERDHAKAVPDSNTKKLNMQEDKGTQFSDPRPSGSPSSTVSSVKCCWCEHRMAQLCCAGWTAIVHLHEQHH